MNDLHRQFPLQGKRILVTRAPHQAQAFNHLLQAQRAEAVVCPLIEIVAPQSWQPLDDALNHLDRYQYLILTSVNAVDTVYRRLTALGMWDHIPAELHWLCVGPKTALALQALGRQPDLQPDSFRAEAIVELLLARGVADCRILYPRAELARDVIPRQLSQAGAMVDAPVAYRTVPASHNGEELVRLLQQQQLDVITFGSSSSVENFVSLLGDQAQALTRCVVLASIGPLTTATADRLGLRIDVEAEQYTLDGLVAALIDYFNPSAAPSGVSG